MGSIHTAVRRHNMVSQTHIQIADYVSQLFFSMAMAHQTIMLAEYFGNDTTKSAEIHWDLSDSMKMLWDVRSRKTLNGSERFLKHT